MRCQNPERPIRALLEPVATPQGNTNTVAVSPAVTPPPAPVTGAKIDVPDTWEQRPISSAMKAGGAVLHVGSKESDSALVLYTLKRSDVRSPSTFSGMKADAITKTLENGVQSPATTLTINGAKAWQIEISGKTKPADVTVGGTPIAGGVSITYLQTLYEGISEIVGVLSWTNSANYELQKTEFQRVANSLSGIAPTFNLSPAAATPPERDVALQPAAVDSTTARKLRELNDLLKDGLINEQEHAEKRKAILLAM